MVRISTFMMILGLLLSPQLAEASECPAEFDTFYNAAMDEAVATMMRERGASESSIRSKIKLSNADQSIKDEFINQ